MKNKLLLSLAIMSCFAFTACGHEHTFSDATCTTPKTCTECGEVEGTALGHTFTDATCTTAKTCTVCSATEGTVAEHTWVDATCTTAKTCSVCSTTEGEALGHKWIEATTEAPKTCETCALTEGEPLAKEPEVREGTVATLGMSDEEITYYAGLINKSKEDTLNLNIDTFWDLVKAARTGGGNNSGGNSGGNNNSGNESGGNNGGDEGNHNGDLGGLKPAPLDPDGPGGNM